MEENEVPDFIEERDLFGQVIPKHAATEELNDMNVEEEEVNLDVEYAGLGIRILAAILDGIYLIIPLILFEKIFFDDLTNSKHALSRNLISLAVWTIYYGLTESSSNQATFGKRTCGIKVIDENGNRLTFLVAALRYLAQIISVLPLGFGIWAIASNDKKQAWHDMLLGCYVIVNKPDLTNNSDDEESKS